LIEILGINPNIVCPKYKENSAFPLRHSEKEFKKLEIVTKTLIIYQRGRQNLKWYVKMILFTV